MLKTLARFAPHLAGRRRVLALLFVLGLVGAGVSLATPLLGKAFIDAVATRGDYAIIPAIAAALAGLALLDLLLAVVSQRLHARLSADVLAGLRAMLFARCANGPLEAIEPIRHGDLLTRFGTDLPRIQTLLVDGLLGALQSLLFLTVAAAITFTLSPLLAMWSFLGLALALAATTAFRRPMEARAERVREAMATLSHFLAERLAALRAMRLHRSAAEEQQRLTQANARLTHEVVGMQQLDTLAGGVPGLLLTLSLAWIYLVGGRLLEAGAISLGTFVAFVLYQGRLFAPAQGLLGLVRNLQTARASIDRVVDLLQEVPAASTAAPPAPGLPAPPVAAAARSAPAAAIAVHGAGYAYPGKPPVLRGLDLSVQPGERIALVGASGAGKSTLVQLLFGLRTPCAGSIHIEGRSADCAHDALGYAGAEPFLVHASVEENLRYGNPGASRSALERALRLAEAEAFVAALPQGLATPIGGRGLALSDGQRQRLGLARLFLRDPRILVLDEAFSALDLRTEQRVRASLWRVFAGRSAIVISHRAVGLDEFDRVLVLRNGRLEPVALDEARALLAPAAALVRAAR
ncbi:MAG TPA: ABC transporter ATP-binding protein [Rubrivivax sp.]|nr:ABC transporter ATP-binding protein [Rubrivivax sp.]